MNPISIPLDFPIVEPIDWAKWNNLWDKNKKFVNKIYKTKNPKQVYWYGLDIYVKKDIDADDIIKYHCDNINCPELFPSLFDNLDKFPLDLYVVRVLESFLPANPHHDFANESDFNSFRSMLFDNNPKSTWYYQKENKEKIYLKLPYTTNSWYYNDSKIKHGTDYFPKYKKQLIMYRGKLKYPEFDNILSQSIKKYNEYAIY